MSGAHLLLELASAAACLVTARFAWARYQLVRSGYNLLWFVAFLTTALEDFSHGVLAFLFPNLAESWVPWTWASSRLTLAWCLGAAIWMSLKRVSCERVVPVIGCYLLTTAALFLTPFLVDVSWVIQAGAVHRPLDLLLAFLWVGLVAATMKVEAAQIQAPQTFELFAMLGLASHLVMAFGAATLPASYFLIAHLLKTAEYWSWAGAVWWEEHQAIRRGGIGRVLQQRFKDHEMERVWDRLQRRTRHINTRLTELAESFDGHATELRRSL